MCDSHVGGLLVVVDVVDVPGQTEVSDLHHIIFGDQHVPGRKVSVDTLQSQREKDVSSRASNAAFTILVTGIGEAERAGTAPSAM